METVLSAYPIEVVREVTSVETGLQRTCTFPPRTAEIVKACDALVARDLRYSRFRNWGKREPEPDLGPRMTKEELEERYGGSILPPGFGESKLREPSGFKTGQALFGDKLAAHYQGNDKAKHLNAEQGRRKASL